MDVDDLIEREGGYVNLPSDRGGPTRFGVTEAVARAHGFAGAMAELPRDEAATIYRRLYWLRPRFDQVAERTPRVAAELFDTGANMARRSRRADQAAGRPGDAGDRRADVAADPKLAFGIGNGMTSYLRGLPEELYALFGTGYLGYTAARTGGKMKGVER
jgi:hypothetical protein